MAHGFPRVRPKATHPTVYNSFRPRRFLFPSSELECTLVERLLLSSLRFLHLGRQIWRNPHFHHLQSLQLEIRIFSRLLCFQGVHIMISEREGESRWGNR